MDAVKCCRRGGGFHIRVTLLQFVVVALGLWGLAHGKSVRVAGWTDVDAPDYAAWAASQTLSVHDILGRISKPRRELQELAPGPSPPTVSESSMSSTNTTAIAAVVCVLIIVVGGVLACYCYQRKRNGTSLRKRTSTSNMKEVITSITQANGAVTVFTLKELEKATENFGEHLVLGLGGFGTVYKGTLRNGMVHVAIKVSNATSKSGKKQLMNEISILSQTAHPNLVQLFGCCIETEVPILVYEYIPNGNLFEHLHRLRFGVNLNWAKRLQIASETADALAYLHFAAQPPIYHRDVKSANILLDNTFSVKVADFGISRLTNPEKTHVSTAVQGTPGYLDPEYFHSYHLTDKSDVYSFGVVLLELLTGRLPLPSSPLSSANHAAWTLCDWVRTALQNGADGMQHILDPDLRPTAPNAGAVWTVADLAMRCVEPRSVHRPFMAEVVQELRNALALEGDGPSSHDATHIIPRTSSEFLQRPVQQSGDSTSGTAFSAADMSWPR